MTSAAVSIEHEIDTYRRELTGYCYRMLGSPFEAEDAVQETMVRAWRSADSLKAKEAMRSWLYRIATNVCLTMLQSSQRRVRPMDLQEPSIAETPLGPQLAETTWIQPIPDDRLDPAELAANRETVRLAFVAALQHLPPKQRAVLILREVLRWQASEVAELLETSVASVNSALQRARATIDEMQLEGDGPTEVSGEEERELLARYVDCFERYDIDALVELIHEDATFSMPPWELWLQGPEDIGKWFLGQGIGCKNARLLTTSGNGMPAGAVYKWSDETERFEPWNVFLLEARDGKLAGIHNFIYPELFEAFGLPPHIDR